MLRALPARPSGSDVVPWERIRTLLKERLQQIPRGQMKDVLAARSTIARLKKDKIENPSLDLIAAVLCVTNKSDPSLTSFFAEVEASRIDTQNVGRRQESDVPTNSAMKDSTPPQIPQEAFDADRRPISVDALLAYADRFATTLVEAADRIAHAGDTIRAHRPHRPAGVRRNRAARVHKKSVSNR